MKKSFQTKESEFAAADHSEISGVLSLIPSNSYVIVMRKIHKTLTCPQICSVGGKNSGEHISLLLVSRDLCGKEIHYWCLDGDIVYLTASRNAVSSL